MNSKKPGEKQAMLSWFTIIVGKKRTAAFVCGVLVKQQAGTFQDKRQNQPHTREQDQRTAMWGTKTQSTT